MRPSSYKALRYTAPFLTMCFMVAGCSMFSGGPKIHTSAKGSIQLQEVADWSFEASHPAVIDHMTMLKILKGVLGEDSLNGSTKLPASGTRPMRVFSDEDAEFLAPLLAQGLSQAKPEQIVGFTVSSSAGSGADPTAGTLYVQGGSIHLTIASSSSRKASGFMPSSTARIEKAPSYASVGASGAMSLVIDYQALAKSPMPAASPMAVAPKSPVAPMIPVAKAAPKQESPAVARSLPVSTPTPADSFSPEMSNEELLNKKMDELRQARESNALKESEIKMLRKEVEWMKQELRERSDEIKAMKAGRVSARPAPKKKTAEAYPVR